MKPRTLVILLFLAVTLPGFGQSAAPLHDPIELIGMDMKAATDALGLPQDVFSFRGSEESRDSVVFYYADHLYLFWYKDHVWQVRYDKRYAAPVRGFTIGMTTAQAQTQAHQSLVANGDSLYNEINERAYPVRMRLLFTADVLSDIYVYRSDF
jgi:hypothetical protein